MSDHDRHVFVWKLLRPLAKLLTRLKFNYSAPTYAPKGPFLLLSNHVTDWDPILLGAAFAEQMYFVASEHIYRLGFLSRALLWLQAPIARQKGGSAAGTVKAMLRTLKDGYNVALFPEGNRTWDGLTRDYPASTAKLVRSCGASLVTFRLQGGYFASPRWAGAHTRRGKMRGEVVGIYTPEQLKAMSQSEIRELITRDLYEDAYARQREENIPFKGSRLAEHLETLLFTCPRCGTMHRMVSRDDRFCCEHCGYEVRYLPTGFFEGRDAVFTEVPAWNAWQDEQIAALCSTAGDSAIFSDDEIQLRQVQTAKGSTLLGTGSMTLYRDRLILPGGVTLTIDEISGMALRGCQDLYIGTADGRSYEIHTEKIRCTLKYLTAASKLGCSVGVGV